MRIDKKVYQTRKDVANKKLESMLNFVQEPICRSILLLKYFGQEGQPCGKCDVCLAEEKSNYSASELQEIITNLLNEKAFTLDEFLIEIKGVDKQYLVGVLNWMMDEDILEYKEGSFSIEN